MSDLRRGRADSRGGSVRSDSADSRISKSRRSDADAGSSIIDNLSSAAADAASAKRGKLTPTMSQQCKGRSLLSQKRKEVVVRHQIFEAVNTEPSGDIQGVVFTHELRLVALADFKLQDINE